MKMSEPEYQRKMAEALNQPEENHKILAYNNKAPLAREGKT